jgi:hypothetical protein
MFLKGVVSPCKDLKATEPETETVKKTEALTPDTEIVQDIKSCSSLVRF